MTVLRCDGSKIGTYLLLGLSNDGREDSLGGIFTSQTGLASTGTIVNDDGRLELHDESEREVNEKGSCEVDKKERRKKSARKLQKRSGRAERKPGT